MRREMNRVKSWDLNFAGEDEVLPTIEVDTDDDYLVAAACGDAISKTLSLLAKAPRVTVYVYEGPSINFGRQTDSIFYAVAGPERTLAPLHAALNGVPGAEVRFSDYIHSGKCVRRYHVEKSVVWRVADEDEWEAVPQY
jgi:hypothetical protein